MATFGQRLRSLREDAGLTQSDLGKRLRLTQSSIAYYEADEKQPSQRTLQNIADQFRVTVDYLIGRTDNPDPPKHEENPLDLLPEGWQDEVMQLVNDPLGTRVRKMREARKWSVERLAAESGVSDELIAILETSSSSDGVKRETIKKLAAAFKINPAALTTKRVVDLTPVLSHLPEGVREKVMDPSYAPFVQVAVSVKDDGITLEVLERMAEMMKLMNKQKNDD